jgi:hypothetical protein
LHREREREDSGDRHAGAADREDDAPDRAEAAAAVHPRRLLELARNRLEVAHHLPRAERDREPRIDDDQGPPRVEEPEPTDHSGERDEQDDPRHEIRGEDRDADVLGAGQSHARERVTGWHRRHHRDRDDTRRQLQRVEELGGEVRLREQPFEVLQCRRAMEPERRLPHPVEVGVLLEGGDHHPGDRKHGEDHERRDAGADEQMTAGRAPDRHGAALSVARRPRDAPRPIPRPILLGSGG